MAKAKATSSKIMSKTAGRKKRGFTEVSATTTSRKAHKNSRSTHKKNVTPKYPTLLQKLKYLAAEAEDYEEIVYNLIFQDDSDNSNKSRYLITTKSTVISVSICQTGYTSPMIVNSFAFPPGKRIGTLKKFGFNWKKEI